MLKFIWFLLAVLSLSAYVLFDSKALEFEGRSKTATNLFDSQAPEFEKSMPLSTGLVRQERAVPVFRWERLEDYFNKLVSKFSK